MRQTILQEGAGGASVLPGSGVPELQGFRSLSAFRSLKGLKRF
jgi:hypothetical protein